MTLSEGKPLSFPSAQYKVLESPKIAEKKGFLPQHFPPPKRNDQQLKIDEDGFRRGEGRGSKEGSPGSPRGTSGREEGVCDRNSIIAVEHDDFSSHPSLKTMRRAGGGAKTFDFQFEEPIQPVPRLGSMSRSPSGINSGSLSEIVGVGSAGECPNPSSLLFAADGKGVEQVLLNRMFSMVNLVK